MLDTNIKVKTDQFDGPLGLLLMLIQKEEIICGIKQTERNSTYNTISNYARFVITQDAYDKLKKDEILLIKII